MSKGEFVEELQHRRSFFRNLPKKSSQPPDAYQSNPSVSVQ